MCDCYREIQILQNALALEKLKCKIYKQILEKKLEMKLEDGTDDLILDMVSSKRQRTTSNNNTTIQPDVNPSPEIKKKSCFKPPPKNIEIVEEPPPEDTKKIDEMINEEIVKTFGVFDIDIIKDQINSDFNSLKDARNYSQYLTNICNNRQFFLSVLSPADYTNLVQEHLTKLKNIFTDKGKKISSLYQKFLSPIDYRICTIEGFEKQNVEIEEINKLKLSQKLSIHYPKTYRIFNHTDFYNYFLTYSLAFCSIRELFENYVNNPYNFKNLIYLNNKNNNENPYSFYTLSKIDNGKRFWKMDCRLELLTNELVDFVKNYCINLFKTIYKSCFGNNVYNQDYRTTKQILEFDCEQILQNLFMTFDFIKINNIFREIVKNTCSHSATSNDKFDFISEDKEQNFSHYKCTNEELIDTVKLLFDDIDDKDAKSFYEKYTFIS